MRLYLFPITRSRTLIYCKRANLGEAAATSLSPPLPPTSKSTPTPTPSNTPAQPPPKPPLLDRITARANATWTKWESEPRGWKRTVTGWGNQAFARIPYQEWGLKSIPPLPRQRRVEEAQLAREIARDDADPARRARRAAAEVDVILPGRSLDPGSVTEVLRRLSGEKKGEYRRRIYWSVLAMPFTIPFMLIPVVPNLPFFYLVFRAWSYWRAQAGCAHVEHLLANDLVNVKPSSLLQRVYDAAPLPEAKAKRLQEEVEALRDNGRVEDKDAAVEDAAWRILGDGERRVETEPNAAEAEEALLYTKGYGKVVALTMNMPEVEAELERAHDQVAKLLEKGNTPSQTAVAGQKDKAE